jgi:S1-C subfamily serine protease
MTGDVLDIVLAVLAVLFAIRGFHSGLVVGVGWLLGFVGGAYAGTRIDAALAGDVHGPQGSVILDLAVVLVLAFTVAELVAYLGVRIRRVIRFTPLRAVDGLGGAALSMAAFLFVAWVLGLFVINSPFTTLARQVRHSRILTAIDSIMPNQASGDLEQLIGNLVQRQLPLFIGINSPLAPGVPPPITGAVPAGVVRADAPSIVKISAIEPECSQQTEGSGFVVAAGHVLTNAHVVAGSRSVTIVGDGAGAPLSLRATVVLYDPNRDVAVLDVPGLARTPLRLAPRTASPGSSADVIGYPENGPFTVRPARIRDEAPLTGPNIYSNRVVTRSVYALRAVVRPGNSGGPLLAPDGRVDGVVFAASTTEPDTGYALTSREVARDAARGSTATAPVGTQGCT